MLSLCYIVLFHYVLGFFLKFSFLILFMLYIYIYMKIILVTNKLYKNNHTIWWIYIYIYTFIYQMWHRLYFITIHAKGLFLSPNMSKWVDCPIFKIVWDSRTWILWSMSYVSVIGRNYPSWWLYFYIIN